MQFLDYRDSVSRPILTFKNKHLWNPGDKENQFLTNNITIEFCHINTILNINCKSYSYYSNGNFNLLECNKIRIVSSDYNHCVIYEFEHKGYDLLWIDISIKPESILEILKNTDSDPDFFHSAGGVSNFGMLSIYLTGMKTDEGTYESDYIANSFFLANGQVAIIDYLPIVKKSMVDSDAYAYGLAGGKRESTIEFDAQMKIIPLTSFPPNTIQLGIRPKSLIIQSQEEAYYGIESIISNVGGFLSSLSGIFVILFGASKIEPWGLMQKSILCCIPCQRSFMRNIAKNYISTAGIPFGQKVRDIPENATLEGLVDRIQMIENLLKEYYIDTEFLESLRKEKSKYENDKHKSSIENGKSIDIDEK